MSQYLIQLNVGRYKKEVKLFVTEKTLTFKFAYNKALIEEIKCFDGARWDPDNKAWTAKHNERNLFQLKYLMGQNPYAWYERPVLEIDPRRTCLRSHQIDMFRHQVTYHYVITAAEMGTGKTLAAIEASEFLLNAYPGLFVWVAPKSALAAADLEFEKWNALYTPQFYTYEGFKKVVETWQSGKTAPVLIVFDECSRLKTGTAQRTIAARHAADAVRKEHGNSGGVIMMSGSPAPKSPADWHSQCEIACPGFLREGNINAFKNRLGIIQMRENAPGAGAYPYLITWRDNENKCDICGSFESDKVHRFDGTDSTHPFKKSVNEVDKFYRRVKGLVQVKFKKDCLELPEKQYRIIRLKPKRSLLNAAELLIAKTPRAITRLERLRELSDGFQYETKVVGQTECPHCRGTRVSTDWHVKEYGEYDLDERDLYELMVAEGKVVESTDKMIRYVEGPVFVYSEDVCAHCNGVGHIDKYSTTITETTCPKDQVLRDLLDEHLDVGRFVTYAGFTASIDRCVRISLEENWSTIVLDGRGFRGINPDGSDMDKDRLLHIFQSGHSQYSRVNFVAHPDSGGMGVTLTASPSLFYFSNCFSGEGRIQSEDRIHRLGMDENRGATIIDVFHLPVDEYVYNNLMQKKALQRISMGDLERVMKEAYAGAID